jgi:hypothetical protein
MTRTLHNLRVLIQLANEALHGPLGYHEREKLLEDLARYETELIALAEGEMNR